MSSWQNSTRSRPSAQQQPKVLFGRKVIIAMGRNDAGGHTFSVSTAKVGRGRSRVPSNPRAPRHAAARSRQRSRPSLRRKVWRGARQAASRGRGVARVGGRLAGSVLAKTPLGQLVTTALRAARDAGRDARRVWNHARARQAPGRHAQPRQARAGRPGPVARGRAAVHSRIPSRAAMKAGVQGRVGAMLANSLAQTDLGKTLAAQVQVNNQLRAQLSSVQQQLTQLRQELGAPQQGTAPRSANPRGTATGRATAPQSKGKQRTANEKPRTQNGGRKQPGRTDRSGGKDGRAAAPKNQQRPRGK